MLINGWPIRKDAKIFLAALLLVVFMNEYIVYKIQSYRWPTFPDIDRYLWKTFAHAFDYSQPDVIIFLGDLFDEGSKAFPEEYKSTLDRFQSIFPQTSYMKTIYIPGDNDIGGEDYDIPFQWKRDRYERTFGNVSDLIKFGFVDYAKLDIVSYQLSERKLKDAQDLQKKITSPITVMLNHNLMSVNVKHFVYPITRRLRPKLIFSAHFHTAWLHSCTDCLRDDEYSWDISKQELTYLDSYLTLDMTATNSMFEITVPTASYRMGTPNIGYGLAIISADKTVQFTVLWSPRRYTMLIAYLIVLALGSLLMCLTRCSRRPR
ncbi:uncharacterized protein LOC127865904 isoform X2 [Dreissena polymorpha]|uniref:uncharacterized protein LOC127865904 isoform X2 n=1 Tax=Dreissena polymorpha TaxID=45954 RepID=UPI0022655B29|nr:uncharacterized protein LOC127865904 isoform X2 [Dreissena polymorpha]